jgi:peptidoglycan/xylan/chitin deacetylase (PgdA/CDA1 family)
LIEHLRRKNVDLVSLSEVHRRLREQDYSRRFVAFTLDDGYRDNREFAWPIFKRHQVPATLFIASSFPQGEGELWWIALERAIAATPKFTIDLGDGIRNFSAVTPPEKRATFDAVYWGLRALEQENDLRRFIAEACARYGIDPLAPCRELCMNWDEIRALAAEPLIEIGAHTVKHYMLRKWPAEVVREEMTASAVAIKAAIGKQPADFAYPVGDPTSADERDFSIAKDAGFRLAVTTRPGVIQPEHRERMTALLRISLNGNFQALRYAETLRSGAPFLLMGGARRG